MVSRRNFFSITIMMIVLFCMFQAPQIIKERINDYETNHMIQESNLTSKDVWPSESGADKEGEYSLLIGSADSKIGNEVMQWGKYRKHSIVVKSALPEFQEMEKSIPEMILLESGCLDLEKDITQLKMFAENGATIVFCNLPSYEQIENNKELQDLLGIRSFRKAKVPVEGYHLYEGFLLGGETIYRAETKEEQEKQDMNLELPWYYLGAGTEVYMTGILEKDDLQGTEIDREFWPAVIWSCSQGEGKVFAVNGDYMTESTGVGLLSAMAYCSKEYDIYPVVDAQMLTVANYPGFADENQEFMQEKFSSSITQVCRDVIYPQILATAEQSDFNMTFMLQPQYDYSDKNEPKKDELDFYLKMINEQDSEAGLSLDYKEDTDLKEKINQDEVYFASEDNEYNLAAAYTVKDKLSAVLKEEEALNELNTMICFDSEMQTLIDYCSDKVTLLSITGDACEHTFSDDFRLKSLETALGYSNVLLDMNRVFWPEEGEETWEKLSINFSSNLSTYWKPFQKFSDTTASEADVKVRNFLNLDYTHRRDEEVLLIRVENFGETASFILRTHGEEIKGITGASYEKLEEDAYLLHAEREEIIIEVGSASMLNK